MRQELSVLESYKIYLGFIPDYTDTSFEALVQQSGTVLYLAAALHGRLGIRPGPVLRIVKVRNTLRNLRCSHDPNAVVSPGSYYALL